jgi:hypothetical protein
MYYHIINIINLLINLYLIKVNGDFQCLQEQQVKMIMIMININQINNYNHY